MAAGDDYLDRTGLSPFADRYPHQPSGGMKQLVSSRLGRLRGSGGSHRAQLVDQQGFDHDGALGYEPRLKTRLRNQRTE